MGQVRRRFELYTVGMADVELFGAWRSETEIVFTHADSLYFRMVRKGNTQLFDALTAICGLPYTLSEDVLTDLLYEVVLVDFRLGEDQAFIRCGRDAHLAEAEKLARVFYDHGFSITDVPDAGGVLCTVSYVPFVASASMSRDGQYLFVRRERFDALMRALTLDLVTGSDEGMPEIGSGLREDKFISVPKLAAYIGNANSDGQSIRELLAAHPEQERKSTFDTPLLGMNAGNTVCIADHKRFDGGLDRFDYCWANENVRPADAKSGTLYYRAALAHVESNAPVRMQLCDGLGFMSSAMFSRLETLLGWQGEEHLNAVQVRLPWCKGLLVRFDFTDFFADQAKEQGIPLTQLRLKDVYGRETALFDEQGQLRLHVLFTASMFKGAVWFKRLTGVEDRWAEYWRRLEAHDISLLIAGKSTPSRRTSRLNYQFIATNGMTEKELEAMAEESLTEVLKARTEPRAMASYLRSCEVEEETEACEPADDESASEERAEQLPELSAEDSEPEKSAKAYHEYLADALEQPGATLLQTGFMQAKAAEMAASELLQLMRGRLPIRGDVRYALPDLLETCRWIAQTCLLPHRECVPSSVQRLNAAHPEAPHGYYYAPGKRVPWTDEKGARTKVAVLRNPHYAAGEEPVLAPLPEKDQQVYDRYFSGLTGCIMLPAAALMTLNGADCDGDRVNVCADERVLTALEARAREEQQLLGQAIHRRAEMIDWLRAEAAQCDGRKRELADYLTLLADELPAILPDAAQSGMPCCAPLQYAGSSAAGSYFPPAELRGNHLAKHLWRAFEQSREQRIGLMSLELLDLAANAYRERDVSFAQEQPVKALCSAFLARYLVIQSALDTALEIDMAKSGLRRAEHPLKQLPVQARRFFGLDRQPCAFRRWRQMYQQSQRRLNGRGFEKELSLMMQQHRSRAQGAVMPLDRLPELAWRTYLERNAVARQTGTRSLHAALREAEWPPEVQNEQFRTCQQRLYLRMQEEVCAYTQRVRHRADQETYHARLAEKHVLMMRWLLGSGCPLTAAHRHLESVRTMLDIWCSLLGTPEKYQDALAAISEALIPESCAAAWGWGDDARRNALLDALLQRDGILLPCPEPLRQLMTGHPRGILLFKHVIRYGQMDAAMRIGAADAGGLVTPDALRSRLMAMVQELTADETLQNEIFYDACLTLYRRYIPASDEAPVHRKGVMNDFLLTYMIGDQLAQRVRHAFEKPARRTKKDAP